MLIFGTFDTMAAGQTVVGLSDFKGNYHPEQRGVVIREATAEEFLAQFEPGMLHPDQEAAIKTGQTKFYLVATD